MDGRKRFEYATCGRVFFFENGGENLRFQKYPDTFGRGLKLPTCRRLAEKTTSGHRTRRFHRP